MRIAVVGATGLVGQEMLKVLDQSSLEITEIIPVASEKSIGKIIDFRGQHYKIVDHSEAIERMPRYALFSAGSGVSLDWAPKYAEKGITVIDNSSAWRMDETKKLIVPEINGHLLSEEDKIIANPNCSTIQLVMVLYPLHKKYDLKRVVVSTYQSFTGTGSNAVKQYELEKNGSTSEDPAYPYPIFANCIPHCDVFLDNGYTKEEMKLVHESRKIMGIADLKLTATAVRVPVFGGHSESVNVEFSNQYELDSVKELLGSESGVIVQDNIAENQYPMPLFAKDKDEVFVGRIRRDESVEKGLNLWIVADNLRKGAATNAVQIAAYLENRNLNK